MVCRAFNNVRSISSNVSKLSFLHCDLIASAFDGAVAPKSVRNDDENDVTLFQLKSKN